MEYEIEDQGEDVLFDDSTNPSLKPSPRQAVRNQPPPHPLDPVIERERRQKAEFIPEEEEQLA